MPFSSSYISQQIQAQNSMFSGQAAYAQQLSYPFRQGQPGQQPGAAPPPMPPPPPMTMMGAAQQMQPGMYGEQMAQRMAGVGRMGAGMAGSVGGIAMSAMGADPFSLGLRAAMAGGGAVGGLGVGLAAAAPMYAAGRVGQHYANNFMGGMQDQAGLNSTLRNNFQHLGGQGSMGRGFSQQQMGGIGQVVQREMNSNPFTNAGELNSLISGGAESGMFTGVRDVQQFSQRFKRMLDTLKTVQDELGGTLTEALSFVRTSRQSGIFQQVDRSSFASQIRGAEATTGMNRQQLMGMASQGAEISRSVGGLGRQGAFGSLRMASQLGSAISGGMVSEEGLSEATGGLQGADAVQAFVGNMMQRSARHSRRGAGRYAIFGLSNEEGTGLDEEQLQRMRYGDIGAGELSRRAHRNVSGMGRARALNQEGQLRGAMLEQGGLSGMIGEMRMRMGDRVLDGGDERAQNYMRRRMGMSQSQSQVMMSLMRNQGSIAQEEDFQTGQATRQQLLQTDQQENRSVDAVMRNLSHGVAEATGTNATRELGRKFVTRVSSLAERVMEDIVGVAESRMSEGDHRSMNRLMTGRASNSDMERLALVDGVSGELNTDGGVLARRMGTAPRDILRRRGGGQGDTVEEQMRATVRARQGDVSGRDAKQLGAMEADTSNTTRQIMEAQVRARGSGRELYQFMGGASANATDAFMERHGVEGMGAGFGAGSLLDRGGGRLTEGMLGRDLLRAGTSPLAAIGMAAQTMSPGVRRAMGSIGLGSEVVGAMEDPRESAADYIAAGGGMGEDLRAAGYVDRNQVMAAGMGVVGADAVGGVVDGAMEGMGLGGIVPRVGSDRLRTLLRAQGVGTGGGSDLLTGLKSDRESVMALAGNEEFRTQFDRVLSASGGASLDSELDILQGQVAAVSDDDQRAAGQSILMNARRDAEKGGELSDRTRNSLRGLRVDPERQREIRRARNDAARGYGDIAEAVGGDLGKQAGEIAGGLRGNGDPRGAINNFMNDAARMDPEDEEARRRMMEIGGTENGRQINGEIAQRRRLQRDLSGRGRRGARGQSEAGLGMITGNTVGDMDITVGGRRLRSPAAIDRMLARGGDNARSVQEQIAAQMGANEETTKLIADYAGSVQSGSGRGRLDETEQDRLINAARSNDQVQERQASAAQERLRSQNPLDAQRNDHLQNIEHGITALTTAVKAGGVGTGEA